MAIEIKIDVIQGSTSGGRKALGDLEREVLESQKRVTAASKAADKAVQQSKKNIVDSQISDLRRLEKEQKKSADNFLASLKQIQTESAKQGSSAGTAFLGAFTGAFGGTFAFSAIEKIGGYIESAATKLFDLAKDAASAGGVMGGFQTRTGLAADSVSTLSFNAKLAGKDLSDLQRPLIQFTSLIGKAKDGSDKAIDSLAKFGVTRLDDLDGALGQAFEAIKRVPPGIGQMNASAELFGRRGGLEMLAVMKKMPGTFDEAKDAAKRMGVVLSQDEITAAKDFNRAWLTLQTQLKIIIDKIATEYMPSITHSLQDMSGWLSNNQNAWKGWGQSVGNVISGAIGDFSAIAKFFADHPYLTHVLLGGGYSYLELQGMENNQPKEKQYPSLLHPTSPIWGPKYGSIFPHQGTPAAPAKPLVPVFEDPRLKNYKSPTDPTDLDDLYDTGGGKGSGRARKAIAGFTSDPDLRKFGQAMSNLSPGLRAQIIDTAARYGIPDALALAQIFSESTFNPGAISPQGAIGLTQGMPRTFGQSRFGGFSSQQMKDPKNALTFWAKYMSYLFDRYGDWDLATLAYHQGEGKVDKLVAAWAAGKSGNGIIGPKGQAYLGKIDKLSGGVNRYERKANPEPFPGADPAMLSKYGYTKYSGESYGTDQGVTTRYSDQDIENLQKTADLYADLSDAIFNLTEHSKEEIAVREVSIGKYRDENEETKQAVVNVAKLQDQYEALQTAKEKARGDKAENDRQAADLKQQLQTQFQDVQSFFRNKIDTLISGGPKNLWRSLLEDFKREFIDRAARMLAQLFGGGGQGSSGQGGFLSKLLGGSGSGSGGLNLGTLFGGNSGNGIFNFGGGGAGGGSAIPQIKLGNGLSVDDPAAGGLGGGSLFSLSSLASAGSSAGVMLGISALQSKTRKDDWIAGVFGITFGLVRNLFGSANQLKKIKEAALATYGLTIKDKDTLNAIKQIGETYFGKGKAGANATQLMQVDEVKNILRNYASATNQNGDKIDMISHADPNWEGNQFSQKFGGFRASGGPVRAGMSYVVGERGQEMFTPAVNGNIIPNGGGGLNIQMIAGLADALYGIQDQLARLKGMPAGHWLQMGASENPEAIYAAHSSVMASDPMAPRRSVILAGGQP